MSDISIKDNERIDDLDRLGRDGRPLKIIQDPDIFCFGMDAVLLSSFAKAGKNDQVMDLCTGNGAIPILMSAKTDASHFTGLEIQQVSASLAKRSVELNHLESLLDIVEGDVKEVDKLFDRGSYSVVTCNPPYMIDSHGLRNPNEPKAIARHEICCKLEDVIAAAEYLLKSGGRFYMVHRPFRLAEIICQLRAHHLEPKRMRLVYPYIDKEPNMVLIEALHGGKPRMSIEPALVVYDKVGVYTKELLEVYGIDT